MPNSLQLTHKTFQSSILSCILSQIHSRPCFSVFIFNSTHSYTQIPITIYNKLFCPLFSIVSYLRNLRLKSSVSRCPSEISSLCLSVSSGKCRYTTSMKNIYAFFHILSTSLTLLLKAICRRYNLDKIASLNETQNGEFPFHIRVYVFSFNFTQIKDIRSLRQVNF